MSRWIHVLKWNRTEHEAGCYALYDAEGLLYIGCTADMRTRLLHHIGRFPSTISIKVKYSRRRGDHLMWEYRLLHRLRPRGNTKLPEPGGRGVPIERILGYVNDLRSNLVK